MPKYQVYTPDGFTLERGKSHYNKIDTAREAIEKFVRRFSVQGYYSTIKNGQRYRMPLWELEENLNIITL